MALVVYRIVEHDGGWAYRAGETYSETFATHDEAKAAAVRAAHKQMAPDENAAIEYETSDGRWVTESADGHDRPVTEVED